ncbi:MULTISPECIES: ABC transporter ATP-binding protein [unclassified Crossiella]|uniref:ABC transporter ATP-binding protein n=1 Tax=unclassified Crossiella TaxID=2620835 RepID=UPI001FFF5383|nr:MULTISPECIES: ABC transporter ATP-binding protein [unclassified Crossiella]MCK2243291.1 ABC transporter ATP-binding protein [Crossiella sp. S99.2]MCK2254240.1 ABC transporter ATP-binding protein [Crossiella sp. S99.1]
MLEINQVSAGYHGRIAVADVTVAVPQGSWLAVIGPNGAGKSTLLKAVANAVPHTGAITLAGTPVTALTNRARARRIGYAPQTPTLPEGLTVTDYALLGRTPHLGFLAREGPADLTLVADVLARLDLTHLADRPLPTLSGGERQRAVLARVLAQQAGLLLLDEPTTGLDIGHAQSLLDLVDRLRLADGTTVVSTLHDLTLAGQYADQLLMLDGGRVVAAGTPAEVLTAERVSRHYGARAEVLTAPDGSRVVTPVRAG